MARFAKMEGYPNLFRELSSGLYYFRKYSSLKKAEFQRCLGEFSSKARAHKYGSDLFNEWCGKSIEEIEDDEMTFADMAQVVKMECGNTRSVRNQIDNHLIPRWGQKKLKGTDWESEWKIYFNENEQKRSKEEIKAQIEEMYKEELSDPKKRREFWHSIERKIRDNIRDNARRKLFNTRKYFKAILNRSHDRGIIRNRVKAKEKDPRTKVGTYLAPEQIQKVIDIASPNAKLIAAMMYFNGFRPIEACRLSWDMIDLAAGTILAPARIVKDRRDRFIPIHPFVRNLLIERAKKGCTKWVFPSPVNPKKHIVEYKTGFETALRKSGIDATPYDLRRSLFTEKVDENKNVAALAKLAGTSPRMIWDHYYQSRTSKLEEVIQ
jgi:integrase